MTMPRDGSSLIPPEMLADMHELEQGFTVKEFVEFHKGAADAGLMLSGRNKATMATKIYAFMLMYWRAVDTTTFEKLLNALTKIFGHNYIGSDPKRLRQICDRIGKKFPTLPAQPQLKIEMK